MILYIYTHLAHLYSCVRSYKVRRGFQVSFMFFHRRQPLRARYFNITFIMYVYICFTLIAGYSTVFINTCTHTIQTAVESDFFVLTPFPTKPDVTMATPPRPPLQDSTHFDSVLSRQDSSVGWAYLEACKRKPKTDQVENMGNDCDEFGKNKDVECMEVDNDDDVIITSPDMTCPQRGRSMCYKLLQFHTNHRPAYFGTWRKRSKIITPRNPFKKDTVQSTCKNAQTSGIELKRNIL